ncbi:MAG: hypothetical protein J1F12_09240, partial [Muribaculaceae bacterium]|nr:hypothetical protein [Muribaculaceae bacterium]
MKQFFQKYLDKLFVAIVILFAALPTSASTKIGDLYYNLDSSTYTAEVTSYSPSSDGNQHYVKGEITIPASVTYDSKIYSVTSIGMSSFDSCTGLTSI